MNGFAAIVSNRFGSIFCCVAVDKNTLPGAVCQYFCIEGVVLGFMSQIATLFHTIIGHRQSKLSAGLCRCK